ncbi:hypothetical protein HNY73_022215 [Argiope bruennichi]|uniref:Uncharacterized protein n=1 Tax=Argiope bruennichi TaxID=94029 RepID=A0A8T0E1T9_ARGBR|nr:hypothetical protein HNY73_022215 [Argiope bruennichi]
MASYEDNDNSSSVISNLDNKLHYYAEGKMKRQFPDKYQQEVDFTWKQLEVSEKSRNIETKVLLAALSII